jgi:hypothetical protein
MYQNQLDTAPLSANAAPMPASGSVLVNFYICIFILGWITQQFALLNVGRYSIILIYLAALPFCARVTQRSLTFLLLPLISTFLAAMIGYFQASGSRTAIVSQGALQMLAIFFAAGVAAIDWRTYFLSFTKAFVVMSVPIVAFGGYQMIARAKHLPYAFLPVTNQQEYAEGGLQRGWEKDHFTRASATFVEPSEFGYFSLWLLLLGLSASKGRWRLWALGLALCGVLFSQSLSAALGAAVLLLAYLVVNPINFNALRQIAIVAVVAVMAIFSIAPLMPEAFDAFSKRIDEAVTLDSRADSGRVDHLPANWRSFMEEPVWGHGLGSASSAESSGIDVTTFTYFLLLIERGTVGTILFLAPWIWLAWRSVKLPATDVMRTPCVLMSALNFYIFASSSMAYTLMYWLALGICAACVLRTYAPSTHAVFRGWVRMPQFGGIDD